ncbi:MAG: ABC transporter permease, partial [Anaerolineales bacterium]
MKFLDLLRLIFSNLNRRKARVALTAIGVVIGTAAVVILVSLAIGLQQNANSQLYGIGDLTQIQVYPGYIEGPPGGQQPPTFVPITDDVLKKLAALPGVVAVIPRDYLNSSALMRFNRLEGYPNVTGVGTADLSQLGLTAARGSLELKKGTVIVGAMVAANLYDPRMRPGQEPPPPPDLYDQQIKLILIKWDNEGNEIRKTVTLRVAGVLTETRGESDWTMYLPFEDLTAYNEWAMGRRINRSKDGYSQVI